ncbi:hypothetical protein N8014_03980 [Pseudomonadota bacterium]|nr:hypothetical protein [Pseudomonadota bacterium]
MKIKSENFANFINDNQNIFKFILLYGSNIGLVNLLFTKAINVLSIDVNDPFNVSKFYSQNLINDPNILIDTITTFTMTSDKRIILLDLTNNSLRKNMIDNIMISLSSEVGDYLVIIKADNLGAMNELVKFTQNSKFGILVPCYEDTPNQIKLELSTILIESNFMFSDSFLSHLSTKFSNDSSINKMEFDKLRNFLINNKEVTETVLLSLVTDNTNVNLNKLSNFCALGDVKGALFFYEKILDSSISPIAVIRTMVKHFKMIERVLCYIEDGKNIEDAINSIKPTIFFKDKPFISNQSKLWSLPKINLILKRLADTEIKCKSGLFLDKLLTAQLILSTSVMAKNAIRL